MDLEDVVRAVDRAFAHTGAATPGWPDPHPDRNPTDDEYSRCLDPDKYRIIAARIEAWTDALTDFGLASAEPVADPSAVWAGDPPYRIPVSEGWWLRPRPTDAIPLLVCLTDFSGGRGNGLLLGAGDPAVEVELIPDCGCDACDSGSADLLELIDERVLDVVSGAFVRVTTPEGTAKRWRNGWSASGFHRPGVPLRQMSELIDGTLRDADAGRSPHAVVRGAAWW